MNAEVKMEGSYVQAPFGSNNGYRSGTKNTRIIFGAIFCLVSLCMFSSLFSKQTSKRQAPQSEFDQVPELKNQMAVISVPLVALGSDSEQKESKARERKKQISPHAPIFSFSRPQLILRDRPSIPPGSMVKAILVSGGSNGELVAELTESLHAQGETLLPSKTRLFGVGSSSDKRLFIEFTQAILPDSKTINISAQALDQGDKIVGLKGDSLSSFTLNLLAGAGLNFISGFSQGLKEQEVQNGVAFDRSNVKNGLLSGISTSALDLSQENLNEMKKRKDQIEVKEKTPFFVLFSQTK